MDKISLFPILTRLQSAVSDALTVHARAVVGLAELATLQLCAAHAYADLTIDNLRVGAEVRDFKGLQSYLNRQVQLLRVVIDKMALDVQAICRTLTAVPAPARAFRSRSALRRSRSVVTPRPSSAIRAPVAVSQYSS